MEATAIKAQEDQKGDNLWFGIDLKTCTQEEFMNVANTNPKAREDYVMNHENFTEFDQRLEEMAKAAQAAPPATPPSPAQQTPAQPAAAPATAQQTPPGSEQVPPQAPAEEEIVLENVKIPKSLFGTYLTGRTPAEAVAEALRGNAAKDAAIKARDERLNAVTGETFSLRKQLTDTMVKLKTASAQQTPPTVAPVFPSFEVDEVDFTALENADFLDPDDHEKIRDGIKKAKKLQDTVKSVKAQLEAAKAQHSPQQTPPAQVNIEEDPDIKKLNQDAEAARKKRDIAEIEMMVSQVPELRMQKSFIETDADVFAFQQKVGEMAGNPGNLTQAVNYYFGNTPESQRFRDLCKAQNVVPPVDYEKHQAVYRAYEKRKEEINALRDEYRDNPPPGFSMFDYYQMTKGQFGIPPAQTAAPAHAVPPQSYQQTIENHVAEQHAFAPAPGTVPDIPPSAGVSAAAPITEAEINAIAAKINNDPGSLTQQEAIIAVEMYAAAGLPVHSKVQKIANGA